MPANKEEAKAQRRNILSMNCWLNMHLQGKKVVRLKGGDVSVFSNLLDELQALNKYSIPMKSFQGLRQPAAPLHMRAFH